MDHENEKFNENMYNILEIKLLLFFVFHGGHEVNFLMSYVCVHEGTLIFLK